MHKKICCSEYPDGFVSCYFNFYYSGAEIGYKKLRSNDNYRQSYAYWDRDLSCWAAFIRNLPYSHD